MPDRRRHRGPHPEDRRLFGPESLAPLREAASDLCWLLTRGYAPTSALKLVGDRHGLNRRQRLAVRRCCCAELQRRRRVERRVDLEELRAADLTLDGFNVLTTVEAAIAGGVVLHARDGCFRDMASVHGTYRKVQETLPAVRAIGAELERCGVGRCVWYLDRPVANSGVLRAALRTEAAAAGWSWQVELATDPDRLLRSVHGTVATADSGVLDAGVRWVNLARAVVEARVDGAWIVDLSR